MVVKVQTSTEPGLPAPEHDTTRWFAEEVQPNDSSLRAYLRHAFPTVHDVDDLVQESYLRIWKVRASRPVHSARSFLFKIARRLAIDVLRRRRTSRIESVPDLMSLPVADARPGVVESASLEEELWLLTRALHALPPRCREVMVLRKIEGLSQKEIAARLGVTEGTVQVHVVQGLRKLEEIFVAYGAPGERT
jgi:RNA polymerase sigma-70 factor (ECF subfamily)